MCGIFTPCNVLYTTTAHLLSFGQQTAAQNKLQHEKSPPTGCTPVQAPTNSALLEGRWRLLFTTRPGSASPIQRTFTGVDAFTVYQEILLGGPVGARVNNIVDFGGKIGQLKVQSLPAVAFPSCFIKPRWGGGSQSRDAQP